MASFNEEIAKHFFLSTRTVERHISNIYSKIGVSGKTARAAATAYAIKPVKNQVPFPVPPGTPVSMAD